LAALNHPYPIQLRTGCFCNPGACQLALGLDDDQVVENFVKHGHSCGDAIDIIDGKPTGAIRASLGKDNIWEEVDALVTFIERLFVSNLNGTAASNGGDNNNNNHDDRWDAFPRRVVLSELYVFPIKSCAAQKVERWKLDTSPSSGKLLWDREFALVDASGNAMRLQNYPAMASIQPTMNFESRVLTVNAPGKPTLEIQLQEDYLYEQQHHDRKSTIKVCGKSCRGRIWGDVETSQWFSEHLGVQCWLARYVSGRYELPLSFLGNRAAPEPPLSSAQHHSDVIAFANEQPILLISENAVDALNEILSEQGQRLVTSKSFRPNMVVRVAGRPEQQSSNAHAEDGWTHVQLINVNNENSNNTGNSDCGFGFDVVGQCARCGMVDVDPSTGLMKGKALRALADYRRSNGQITFGIFLRGAMMEHATTTTTNLETKSQTDVWIREGDMLLCQ
jgi:molybdenum cofactor sulfurtransferase